MRQLLSNRCSLQWSKISRDSCHDLAYPCDGHLIFPHNIGTDESIFYVLASITILSGLNSGGPLTKIGVFKVNHHLACNSLPPFWPPTLGVKKPQNKIKFLLEAKIGRPMCSRGFVVCYYYHTALVLTKRGSHYCLVVHLANCARTLPIACNQEGHKVIANPGKV